MRKQITTTLKFSELDKMPFHEVIRMMGFSFNNFNEVPESIIKDDINKMAYPIEYTKTDEEIRNETIRLKVFLIIYLFIYRAKFGAKRYGTWYDIMKALHNTLGTENSVFTTETNLIKWNEKSIVVDIDENAFIDPSKEFKLLKYDNIHINDAPKHLAIIIGPVYGDDIDFCFDYTDMIEFCGAFLTNLAYEVNYVCDYLRQKEEWHFKQFRDKFNSNNPPYRKLCIPIPDIKKQESLYPSDYLYYLFFIKTLYDWDVSRAALKKYFEASIKSNNNRNVNPYDVESKRYELLNYFNELVKVWDSQFSFCYEEHLFALKNRFKSEYVLNLTMTPIGVDTELYNLSAEPTEETSTDNSTSPIVDLSDYPAVKDEPSDFVSIANKQIELYKKKNKDYGNATDILYKKHGFTYYQIMLEQKMQRIDSITNNNKAHNFESLEDSLLDLSNYAILAVESLRKEKQGKQ